MSEQNENTKPRNRLRYPEDRPSNVDYRMSRLLNEAKSKFNRKEVETICPETFYLLNVSGIFAPGVINTINGETRLTQIPPTNLSIYAKPIFDQFLYFSDIPVMSPIPAGTGIVLQQISRNVSADNMPAQMFKIALWRDAQKPIDGEGGNEAMARTGGHHQDFEDISNREGSNGKVMRGAVARSIINILQNQAVYDSKNKDTALKLLTTIEEEGWGKVLHRTDAVNLSTLPKKSVKDVSFDFNNQRLITDPVTKDFILRPFDLEKDGIDAIEFRLFSKDGTLYSDVPASVLLNMSDDKLEQTLLDPNITSGLVWSSSEYIDRTRDMNNKPMINLFITDSFPNPDSKIFKYRGNRGRSMDIGIIDLKEKGRVFVLGGSHLMIDGMAQSKNLRAHLYDMPLNGTDKKVEYPSFMIYPPIPRLHQEKQSNEEEAKSEALKLLGLSDLVLVQKFNNERLSKALSRFNNSFIKPKSDEIRKMCEENGFNEKDADDIVKLFTPFLSRSTFIQQVATASIGRMMNCIPYSDQTYHRFGLAITKSLPKEVGGEIKKDVASQDADFSFLKDMENNLLLRTLVTTNESRMETVLTKLGLPTLGGVQALMHNYSEIVKNAAGFAYSKMLELSHQVGFFSDKVREDGDIFVTAQNHQEEDTSISFGLLKDKITARINFEYPAYLNTLNLKLEIDKDIVDKITSHYGDQDENKLNFYTTKALLWAMPQSVKGRPLKNDEIITNVIEHVLRVSNGKDTSKEIEGLKLLLIAASYQNVRNLMNTSIKFAEALADAVELNEQKIREERGNLLI